MGINAYLPDRDPMFISSWKGFSAFQEALEALGIHYFPTILDQLPDGDEGETSPEKAAKMLEELSHFESLQAQIQQAVLVDTERQFDVSMGSNVLGGALTMDRGSGYDIGFNETGFFVRDRWELDRILFQGMRVEQVLIHPEPLTVDYVNLDTEERFQCNVPLGKIMTGEDGIPRMALARFHVELRETSAHRFSYIINPLRIALEASIESQQAIQWA